VKAGQEIVCVCQSNREQDCGGRQDEFTLHASACVKSYDSGRVWLGKYGVSVARGL
jgi:hypothetical protein